MKRIIFTVTNDLNYDQRMNRICATLAENGYDVLLVGRVRKQSPPLVEKKFGQKRLSCWFQEGKLFYAEYNLRLFFYLLFSKTDALCAIDLDTILPVLWVSKARNLLRIYDAHELFCEMKEVVTRPGIYRFWKAVQDYSLPQFPIGYTVSSSIAGVFKAEYNLSYDIIRNVPVATQRVFTTREKFVLYQGAVNEGRGLKALVEAWQMIDCPLIICGDGNYMKPLQEQLQQNGLEQKIILKGMLLPEELPAYNARAWIGLNLVENTGLNQYYSLANKFFDYIHAGLPQVTMNYPEYKNINNLHTVALLIDDLEPQTIAKAINNLLENDVLHKHLQENCLKIALEYNWQQEEKKLLAIYDKAFKNS